MTFFFLPFFQFRSHIFLLLVPLIPPFILFGPTDCNFVMHVCVETAFIKIITRSPELQGIVSFGSRYPKVF